MVARNTRRGTERREPRGAKAMKAFAYWFLPVGAFVMGWIFARSAAGPLGSLSSNRARAAEKVASSFVPGERASKSQRTTELLGHAVPLVTWRKTLGYPSEARRLAA